MLSGHSLPLGLLLIGLGGALGAWLRFGLSLWAERLAHGFPWGTLAVNLAGSFAAGLALALIDERTTFGHYARAFLLIGVLGGFTTYSALMMESLLLARDARLIAAAVYLGATLIGGLLLVWLGWRAGQWFGT